MKLKWITQVVGFSFSIIIAAILFTGCETYQGYPGSALPRNQVAVLILWESFGGIPVYVKSVDGHPLSDYTRMESPDLSVLGSIQLLPGQHMVTFVPGGSDPGGSDTWGNSSITKDIYVEAGKTYRARMIPLLSPIVATSDTTAQLIRQWDVEITENNTSILVPSEQGDVWFIRYVLVKNRSIAEGIQADVNNGHTLEKAAEKFRASPAVSRWYKRGVLQKQIEDAASGLKEGDCSVVETDAGFFVIQLIKQAKE